MALKLKRDVVNHYQNEQIKTKQYTILLVDDEVANLEGLSRILETEYNIVTATSGNQAMEIIHALKPTDEIHLVISDQRMPQMNGVELFERLIPVIPDTIRMILTGFTDINAIIDAINHGAIYKFLTKPVEPVEMRVTVKRALESLELSKKNKKLMRELLELNASLEHKVLERTRELAEKQRDLENLNAQLETQIATVQQLSKLKEDVEMIIRHDLRSPLNAVISFPRMLKNADNLTPKQKDKLDLIAAAGYQMLDMINHSLDLYKMEMGTYRYQPVEVDLIPLLKKVICENAKLIQTKNITIAISINGQWVTESALFLIWGEPLLCYTLLGNLIKNAIEASAVDKTVEIYLTNEPSYTVIKIRNDGCVPEHIRETFFDKYVTSGKDNGTGLGTYSAALNVKTQQGTLELDISEPSMTSLIVKLPLKPV